MCRFQRFFCLGTVLLRLRRCGISQAITESWGSVCAWLTEERQSSSGLLVLDRLKLRLSGASGCGPDDPLILAMASRIGGISPSICRFHGGTTALILMRSKASAFLRDLPECPWRWPGTIAVMNSRFRWVRLFKVSRGPGEFLSNSQRRSHACSFSVWLAVRPWKRRSKDQVTSSTRLMHTRENLEAKASDLGLADPLVMARFHRFPNGRCKRRFHKRYRDTELHSMKQHERRIRKRLASYKVGIGRRQLLMQTGR